MKFSGFSRVAAVLVGLSAMVAAAGPAVLREGDIVFSCSEHGQGAAIVAATGSNYTHCGIVFEKDGKLMVLEAVQPVGITSLTDFTARGTAGTVKAFRLKKPVAAEKLQRARSWAAAQVGKDYDGKFLWGDDRMYCSELVWKAYQHAGVELCKPRRFQDFKLDDPKVKKVIEERYGNLDALPKDENVVAPADLADSPLLEVVDGEL